MSTLTESEKLLFKCVNENNIEEMKVLLNQKDVKINIVDENGMALVCQAAFKGNHDILQLLLDNGANVNIKGNAHGYTALMFAAIGGHVEATKLLLEYGADVTYVNSVKRNAAQMAGFVGQHQTASIINNFIPRSEVDYFTQIHGLEKEPKLKSKLVEPILALIRSSNVHPLRLVKVLSKYQELLKHSKQVVNILESLIEREMNKSEPNEMLALKYCYIAYFLNYVNDRMKTYENQADDQTNENFKKCTDGLAKIWLKTNENGFSINLENFVRQSIRGFPYHKSFTFLQIVRTLSTVEVGQEPSAIDLFLRVVSGLRAFDDTLLCLTCDEPKPSKKCSRCKEAFYCDRECQRLHWPIHKKKCIQHKDIELNNTELT